MPLSTAEYGRVVVWMLHAIGYQSLVRVGPSDPALRLEHEHHGIDIRTLIEETVILPVVALGQRSRIIARDGLLDTYGSFDRDEAAIASVDRRLDAERCAAGTARVPTLDGILFREDTQVAIAPHEMDGNRMDPARWR